MYYRKILRQYLVQKIIRESMLQNYTCKTSKQPHAFKGKICPVSSNSNWNIFIWRFTLTFFKRMIADTV